MKIKELIELLNQFDLEEEIYIAAESHDYWGSLLALEINDVQRINVNISDYHGGVFKAVKEEYVDSTTTKVLLIL